MRIRPIVLAVFVSAASSAAAPPASPSAPAAAPAPAQTPGTGAPCRFDDLRRHADGASVRPRRLDELPPGDLQLAVYREVDGCMEPVIVRHDFGAPRDGGR